ncbi:calcium-binding protein [Massilia pseudoviolaceinigra]|uniref:calcium-binding protein n=1 Tax=Massilia pseudoviolaceinigra TaxID=3057165 RepID=UPI0027969F35|nr:calcium-binding protein [Massilia sp. CCM 9206]MDQ1919813.1 calcium-binding protein [Massilia sp. CCM 9206]
MSEADLQSNSNHIVFQFASDEHAKEVTANYSLVYHYSDDSGFAASVFRAKDSGKLVIAFRGTELASATSGDLRDIAADVAIYKTGLAGLQILALNTFYDKLFAADGAKLPAGTTFDVTGDSLGGHLATAFTASHLESVNKAIIFEAPGINVPYILLHGNTTATVGAKITHVFGDAGVEIISGAGGVFTTAPGQQLPVFIENQTLSNHSLDLLNQALGVAELLERIDPALTLVDARKMLEAASHKPLESLEKVVDSLRTILAGAEVAPTPPDLVYGNNAAMQTAINEVRAKLNGSLKLVNLVGLSSEAIAARANVPGSSGEAIAIRYALREMLPFAVVGANYAPFNPNGELDVFNEETGDGQLTENYLKDRAAMLVAVLADNKTDGADSPGGNRLFLDLKTDRRLTPFFLDHKTIFGAAAGDAPGYSEGEDHLYGMGGKDVLTGGKGKDYMEGGSGDDHLSGSEGNDTLDGGIGADTLDGGGDNDKLLGGKGKDTLIGGDGNDTLDGQADNDSLQGGIGNDVLKGATDKWDTQGSDTLEGGAGFDFYQSAGGDTIRDSDGQGTVRFVRRYIDGAWRKKGETVYYSWDKKISYTVQGSTLLVNGPEGALTIENWTNGQLEIHLSETDKEVPTKPPFDPNRTRARIDPLVLDLNHDGLINSVGSDQSSVYFDFNGDAIAERTGWISPADGILVSDENKNRFVDNLSELFGNAQEDGFSSLKRRFDGNLDGVIDRRDAKFSELLVWQDANQDGISQAGELKTLDQLGITSIGTQSAKVTIASNDNRIIAEGEFVQDGQTRLVADIELAVNFALTDSNPARHLDEQLELDGEVAMLPRLRGFGTVRDLSYALQDNLDLRAYVSALIGRGKSAVSDEIDQFMARWTGLDAAYVRVGRVRSGELTTMDKVWMLESLAGVEMSKKFIEGNSFYAMSRTTFDESYIAERFGFIADRAALSLSTQAFDKGWLDGVFYSVDQDRFDAFDPARVNNSLAAKLGQSTSYDDTVAMARLLARLKADGVPLELDRLRAIGAQLPYPAPVGHALDGGMILGNRGNNVLQGEAQRDDWIDGGAGNDTLSGLGGKDVLHGGAGDDLLEGGAGADVYLYEKGDGHEIIHDHDAGDQTIDTLRVGAGFTPGATQARRVGSDLVLRFGESESVTVRQYFHNDALGYLQIERIEFQDGTLWEIDKIKAMVQVATAGDEALYGYAASNDVLSGLAGNDTLDGRGGHDTLHGGTGDDMLEGSGGNDVFLFNRGDGSDAIHTYERDAGKLVTLRLGAGLTPAGTVVRRDVANLVLSFGGTDHVTIKDYFYRDGAGGNEVDQIVFADQTVWTVAKVKTLVGIATEQADAIYGYEVNDAIAGLAGNDTIFAYAGDDTLEGGRGDDVLDGSFGNDVYLFKRGDGRDTITDNNGWDAAGMVDVLRLGSGISASTTLARHVGKDLLLDFGAGDSVTVAGFFTYDTQLVTQLERIEFSDGVVWDVAELKQRVLAPTEQADLLAGFPGDDSIGGAGGNDTLVGEAGRDSLNGGAGNDSLSGGTGDDVLVGGAGDDLLEGHGGADLYQFAGGDGKDVLRELEGKEGEVDVLRFGANVTVANTTAQRVGDALVLSVAGGADSVTIEGYFYGQRQRVERIEFAAGEVWDVAEVKRRVLLGGAGSDALTGYETADQLAGAGGNDTLSGYGGADALDGGSGDDQLLGSDGDDTLDGGAGNDSLTGGAGNDVFLFGAGGGQDLIQEFDGTPGKTDTIRLGAGVSPAGVRIARVTDDLRLQLKGSGDSLLVPGFFKDEASTGHRIEQIAFHDGTLWDLAAILEQALLPTEGNDLIAGYTKADSINGGGGDDRIDGGDGADTLGGGAGHDVLLGQAGDDQLRGDAGSDTLDGGVGDDSASGGAGDDLYLVQSTADVVVELPGEGVDTVRASASTTLSANVENLELDALAGAADGIGNALANRLLGNASANGLDGGAGDDWLDGGAGSDVLVGGAGNDVFIVDASTDRVAEGADEGHDTVRASATYALSDNIETLVLENTGAFDGSGNALANRLTGNNYDNRLDGGAGADTLDGGAGTDTLMGGADADALAGGDGGDNLDGGAGADTLDGGQGNDYYVVDTLADQIIEAGEAGFDTVETGLTYTLASELEGLSLTGSADVDGTGNDADNALTGNEGNNRLDGGAGADTLNGGRGDDIYLTDSESDEVNEMADEGRDTIIRSYDTTYILASGVDNLTLVGEAVRGNGNELDNLITGNDADNNLLGLEGNDTLVGGLGKDAMFGREGLDLLVGGAGDDYYEVDDAGDRIEEAAGQGDDFVRANISWTLGENLERLALNGDEALYATGNALANGLWGNAGNNVLTGAKGSDYIEGGAGDDVYVFEKGDGKDTIDNTDIAQAIDILRFGAGILETDVSAMQQGTDVFLMLRGGTDQIAFKDYFAGGQTEEGAATDGKIDRIEFASGAVWDQAKLQTVIDRANHNSPPTVKSYLPTLQAKANALFSYTVPVDTVTDPDVWDTVTYSVKMAGGAALPAWLTFDPVTRVLSGTPAAGNIGTLQFQLWGTDSGGNGAGQGVNLVVGAANRAPVLATALPDQKAAPGTPFAYTVAAAAFTDPDTGDKLSYKATLADGAPLPAWLTFNPATRTFGGTPTATGTASVRVTATDSGSLAVSDVFDVVVGVANLVLNGTANADLLNGGAGNDTLSGMGGNDTLNGAAGNDRLDGGAGADKLTGGQGNDVYVLDSSADTVAENAAEGVDQVLSGVTHALGANVEALTLTGTLLINGSGNLLDNLLIGNGANNVLAGADGNDILQGGAGADTLNDTAGKNVFDGGAGIDTLTGGAGNELFIGGTGNDSIVTSTGADIIAFNRGDGQDTVAASIGKDNTVSLGKGVTYADLLFKKAGNDLVLVTGVSEQLTFKDWYLSANNRNVANLQVVIEGGSDYNAASPNAINNRKVERFNFDGLATAFDQARTANPALTSWALSSSLLGFHLGGSDTAAIGGDLAYQYAKNGNLSALSLAPAGALLAAAPFGAAVQNLQAGSALQDLTPRLA